MTSGVHVVCEPRCRPNSSFAFAGCFFSGELFAFAGESRSFSAAEADAFARRGEAGGMASFALNTEALALIPSSVASPRIFRRAELSTPGLPRECSACCCGGDSSSFWGLRVVDGDFGATALIVSREGLKGRVVGRGAAAGCARIRSFLYFFVRSKNYSRRLPIQTASLSKGYKFIVRPNKNLRPGKIPEEASFARLVQSLYYEARQL